MIWKCYQAWKTSSPTLVPCRVRWKVTPNNSHKVAWKHSSDRMFKDIDFLIQQSQLQLNLSSVEIPENLSGSFKASRDHAKLHHSCPELASALWSLFVLNRMPQLDFVEQFLLLVCTFLLHDVKVHLSCWKHWQKVITPKSSSNSTLVIFLLTPWIILPAFSPSLRSFPPSHRIVVPCHGIPSCWFLVGCCGMTLLVQKVVTCDSM